MTTSKKLKVAFVSSMDMPVPDKMGAAVEKLMTHIIEENEKHGLLSIDLYTVGSSNSKPKYDHTNIIEIQPKSSSHIFVRRAANKVLRTINATEITKSPAANKIKNLIGDASKYDIIIIENNMSIAEAVAKKSTKPLIYHVHNQLENGDKSPKRWQKLSPQLANVITISKFMQNEYATNNHKPKILYNAIDLSKFNPAKTRDMRTEFNIKKNDIIIGYAGRVNAEKGVDKLIKAFIDTRLNDNVKLLIVGDSWYGNKKHDNYTNKLIESISTLKDRVIFTGIIEHRNMPRVYKTMDILVSPTMIEEALSVTVIEAKAMGLPVIVTDSGGMVELVENNINGFIVKRNPNLIDNLSKAIKALVSDKSLRTKMGKINRNDTIADKKFCKEEYYQQFVRILTQTLNKKT